MPTIEEFNKLSPAAKRALAKRLGITIAQRIVVGIVVTVVVSLVANKIVAEIETASQK